MLPLVIAVSMFLGSYFISQAVETSDISGSYPSFESCMEDIIRNNPEYPAIFSYDFPIERDNYIAYPVYLCDCRLSYSKSNDVLYYIDGISRYYHHCYIYEFNDGSFGVSPVLDLKQGFTGSLSLMGHSILYSSFDIYYYNSDEIFFQGPSPFQQAVRGQDWTTVMTEIVIMVPLLILFLVSLIGLRKGLRFVSSFLHRA